MNTKEAIDFVDELRFGNPYKMDTYINKIFEVIDLLKRGEKYEAIFNTILNWTIHDGSFIPVKELINLEQKYFPKPKEEVIK